MKCTIVAPLAVAFALVAPLATAQNRADDEYTRYELLAPETSSFKITFDLAAVTPGATFFFNAVLRVVFSIAESA